MANGTRSKIFQKDNCKIQDEVGNTVLLKNRRVVEGITTPIISLTQLMNEGWVMKSGVKNKQRFIYLLKDDSRLTFVERKHNLFYLRAKITE